MNNKKYSLNNIMTLGEAAERYEISIDKIKNRLKPSKMGQEQIDKWVAEEFIRLSGRTWLISSDFMDLHFKK
jgi:hypothetical protein